MSLTLPERTLIEDYSPFVRGQYGISYSIRLGLESHIETPQALARSNRGGRLAFALGTYIPGIPISL